MAFPAASFQQGFKLTLQFNEGLWGWREAYWLGYEAPAWELLYQDLAVFTGIRKGFLNKGASIYAIQAQWVTTPVVGGPFKTQGSQLLRQTNDKFGGGGGLVFNGPGTVTDSGIGAGFGAEPVWNACLFTIFDNSGAYRRAIELRGLASQYILFKADGTGTLTAAGTTAIVGWFRLMNNVAPQNKPALNGKFCIAGRVKDPTLNGTVKILTAQPVSQGCGTILTTESHTPWPNGQHIHIHNAGQCGASCLNGDTVVGTDIAGVGMNTVTIVKTNSCCGAYVISPKAVCYKVIPGLYEQTQTLVGNVVKRNTGKPFGATKGRRQKCCR